VSLVLQIGAPSENNNHANSKEGVIMNRLEEKLGIF
jgi:hypothetical protein